MVYHCGMNDKIHDSPNFKPSTPKSRRPIRSEEENFILHNNSYESYMESKISRRQKSNSSKNETLLKNDSTNDRQIDSSEDEDIEESEGEQYYCSQHFSPNKLSKLKKSPQSPVNKQDVNNFSQRSVIPSYFVIILVIIVILFSLIFLLFLSTSEKKSAQLVNNRISLFKSMEEIKAKFHNQESDIWNDIFSAINEIILRNPKVPQIILLFANETTTMDCLATALVHISSDVLHIDSPLYLNPENFGDDAGEVIDKLNKYSSAKKVVLIRNVLNINAEAIKVLHNLCDKINPLIREAIYIFTMQTNNYQLSQKKMKFIEDQFFHKLSKNIDRDILMALVTRITDGAIISVQPEPHLRYC